MVLDNKIKWIPRAGYKGYLQWFTILDIHWILLHISLWDIAGYFLQVNS